MVALGHHVHAQDLLEPVLLPKPPEPDHLEPAPEEEDTDTEVKSTPEESDDEVVTEKVKYNSPEPGPPIAGISVYSCLTHIRPRMTSKLWMFGKTRQSQ